MTKTTQCPNCSTVYLITEEQYRQSKGKVRCGTCRSKFSAVFLEDAEDDNQDIELDTSSMSETEFSETTTEESQDESSDNSLISISELSDDFEFESTLHSELSIDVDTTVDDSLSAEGLAEDSSAPDDVEDSSPLVSDGSPEGSTSLGVEGSIEDLFSAEGSLSADGYLSADGSAILDVEDSDPLTAEGSAEESLSESSGGNEDSILKDAESTSAESPIASSELIKQVDELIEEKLFSEAEAPAVAVDTDEAFNLNPSWQNRFKTGFAKFCLVTVCFILTATLGYQLWFKQALPWPTEQQLALLKPVTSPLKEKLSAMQVTLPERRDLSKLELISAKTEAHPTRSSMLLLRVSLFNRAAIEQPLPWLELSLTDEEGRLISRRALSADDYLYNNNTNNNIRANELKKVTIELLAFPKNAHGYELRLLNR